MKRIIISLTVLAVVAVSAALPLSYAADETAAPQIRRGPAYVDSDGDGVCDNIGQRGNRATGRGPAYVDADNDGVCDNRATAGNVKSHRRGNGRSQGTCIGRGRGGRSGRGGRGRR